MKSLLALTLISASAVWAQNQPLRARELFYTPPPGAAPATPPKTPGANQPGANQKGVSNQISPKSANPPAQDLSKSAPKDPAPAPNGTPASVGSPASAGHTVAATVPLGVRYSVLKRNAANQFVEVDPDTTFQSGDRIRLKVQTNTSGYLYVVTQGSSGTWQVLFPSSDVAGGSNRLDSGDTRQIPPGDRGQFLFDDKGGTEKLFLVLARQAEPDLDKLIYSMTGAPGNNGPGDARSLMAKASLTNAVVDRLRQQVASRDLVFEKVDGEVDGKVENAAYVVNPSPAPDARLVVDVALNHK
jgi:hypothetical protein